MMQWVEGFLKKHKGQQAFDNAWKEIPPYPGFSVAKKAYREVTQWQGKAMGNLRRCIRPYWCPHCEIRTVLSITIF